MKGKVVSFVASKKFGFIKGEDGESYFLHVSKLKDKTQENKLIKDAIVSFDPMPTPKGLSATKVKLLSAYTGERLVPFFTAKGEPKHGKVAYRIKVNTCFTKEKDRAFLRLKTLAEQAGCNAVINISTEKRTFSAGNYFYSVFAHQAEFAVVAEEYICDSEEEGYSSRKEVTAMVIAVADKAPEVVDAEHEARNDQLNPKLSEHSKSSGCFGFIGLVLIIFLFFILLAR